MAVAKIEEKILGRLARRTASTNALLSASIYQVLGLSILLQESLGRARRRRKLDPTRDTKSLQLYHHIIWLAREGLSITEVYILPYCQDGEEGPECRVMAAMLRAGFYHVFCLYHNHPPVSQMSPRSRDSGSPPTSVLSPTTKNGETQRSPGTPSRNGQGTGEMSKRSGKAALRDPIPSMNSDTSYVTNPYAGLPSQTPPPKGPPPPIPLETRRTPTRPPGLTPINVSESQSAASFLLPPLNFVPLARDHFATAQLLAIDLLPPVHALRLSVAFDYAVFLWDCAKDSKRSVKVARRTVDAVYDSSEGLSDEEFADATTLVQYLGGIIRRGTNESDPRPSKEDVAGTDQRTSRGLQVDRTIAVSPPYQSNRKPSPSQIRSIMRTPERLSTVPEVESVEADGEQSQSARSPPMSSATSPPISRLSSRSRQRRNSSTTSDKATKRRAAEQAEELHRVRSASNKSNASGSSHSRQPTPQEGFLAPTQIRPATQPQLPKQHPVAPEPATSNERSIVEERRLAILAALEIIASVSQGLWVPEKYRKRVHRRIDLT